MNAMERVGMLRALADAVQDVIRGGWMEHVDFQEEDYRIRWQEDGSGVVMRVDNFSRESEVLRFRVEVACSVVEPPAANQPSTATPAPRYWNTIPAGWFIQDPTGTWWEVLETTADGQYQRVKLRNPKGQVGTWPRRGLDTVLAVPGTAGGPIQGATDALFSRFSDTTIIADRVD